ncbi:energy transducer TonB [Flavobacterium sp. GSB-24]|uniref:energy transducer TonB n=1 Tax=Flavobacterium sp. GSB-24 TaxID=2994319 RepID=UPI002493C31E|nr:energy transducer TonB [Flavobacterium sp. GSB-24]BDU24553.1 hypothetical protein FLGSB24_12970 [Flavobacterium sp. GSB-24]
MRKIFYLLGLLPMLIFSQNASDKIIYFDSIGKDASKENHSSYRIIKDYHTEKDLYQIKDYYKSGVLKMEGNSKTKDGFSKEGKFVYYYDNGNRKREENYFKGRLKGRFNEWYENGNPKLEGEYFQDEKTLSSDFRMDNYWNSKNEHLVVNGNGNYDENDKELIVKGKIKNGYKDEIWTGTNKKLNYSYIDIYKKGRFISGKSTDSLGVERKYDVLEVRPLPKKGVNDFYKFIGDNFVKTKEAVNNKVAGKIIVQFIIAKDGKIVEPKILKSLGYGLDEELVRVITSYENWNSGQQRGVPVRVQYSIPITVTN